MVITETTTAQATFILTVGDVFSDYDRDGFQDHRRIRLQADRMNADGVWGDGYECVAIEIVDNGAWATLRNEDGKEMVQKFMNRVYDIPAVESLWFGDLEVVITNDWQAGETSLELFHDDLDQFGIDDDVIIINHNEHDLIQAIEREAGKIAAAVASQA